MILSSTQRRKGTRSSAKNRNPPRVSANLCVFALKSVCVLLLVTGLTGKTVAGRRSD